MYELELALAKYDLTAQISKNIAESTNLTAKYVWSTNIPPGRPLGFCTLLLPWGRDLYLIPSPGAGFSHIHKITFSTVKKYTFTQLAFGSYLHALHRQFRLSILA